MAVSHITFNDQLQHGRQLRSSLNKLEEGLIELNDILAILARMIDGNGSDASHFIYMVAKLGFPDNDTAKAAYDELQSLAFKLNTDSSVADVNAALRQAFSKFG